MNNIIVNESAKNIRSLARMALKGLWWKAFVGAIIYMLLMEVIPGLIELFIPSLKYTYTYELEGINYTMSFSFVTYIYRLLLSGPIIVGFCSFILRIVRRREVVISKVFEGFEHFLKTFSMQILIGLLVMLWSIPALLIISLIGAIFPSAIFIGTFVMAGYMVWVYLRYAVSAYYMADNYDLKPLEAIRLSRDAMKGNKTAYIFLMLSFIGWAIVASLPDMLIRGMFPNVTGLFGFALGIICDLPRMLLALYTNTAEAFFYEILSGHIRRQEPEINTFNVG